MKKAEIKMPKKIIVEVCGDCGLVLQCGVQGFDYCAGAEFRPRKDKKFTYILEGY